MAVRTRSKIQKELLKQIGHRLKNLKKNTLQNLSQEGQEFDQFLQEMVENINLNETTSRRNLLRSISSSSSNSSSSSSSSSSSEDSLLSYRTDCTKCNVRSPGSVVPGTPDIHDDNAQVFPLGLSTTPVRDDDVEMPILERSASPRYKLPTPPPKVQDMETPVLEGPVSISDRPPTPYPQPIHTPSQSPRSDDDLPNIVRYSTPPASPSSSFELQLQSNEVSSTQDNTQKPYEMTLNTDLTVST